MEMTVDERRELNFQLKRMFRDRDWDEKYQAKMRILNLQRKVAPDGHVYIRREGGART